MNLAEQSSSEESFELRLLIFDESNEQQHRETPL